MFLIEQLSNKIGNKIANNLELDRDTEEIITYGAFQYCKQYGHFHV